MSAVELVDSPYVALLPDDEFFLPSGLVDAIDFLDQDSDSIGCVGRCLYFFVDQGRFLVSHAYRNWIPFPRTALTPEQRLDFDLPPKKSHMSMYGIYRREVWSKMITTAYSRRFSCGFVYERLMNLQRTAIGRTEIIESLIWMRSKENLPVQSQDFHRSGEQSFVNWATSEKYSHEVRALLEIARDVLFGAGLEPPIAENFANRFLHGGLQMQRMKEAKAMSSARSRLAAIALKQTPAWLRMASKRWLPSRFLSFTGWEGYKLSVMERSLQKMGTSFKSAELNHIKELSLRTSLLEPGDATT